jgi:hypothetical protein
MRDIEAIGKDRTNQTQGFKFRGIDDLYNELHPIMAKHGLFSFPKILSSRTEERLTAKGSTNIFRIIDVEYTFCDESGESLVVGPVIGEASDLGDKGNNKALSIAHKYALLQLFCIPTEDEKDPDAQTPPPSIKTIKQPQVAQPPQKTIDQFLTACESHFKRLGEQNFYSVLGVSGFENPREVKTEADKKAVLTALEAMK